MMKWKTLFVASLAVVASVSTVRASSLYSFSSFEHPGDYSTPNPDAGSYLQYKEGDKIDGWTVGGNGVDIIVHAYSPVEFPDGTHAVDLSALAPGSISQTFLTDIGATYSVSFWLSGNGGDPAIKTTVSGAGEVSNTYYSTSAEWTYFHYTFVALNLASTVSFLSGDIPGSSGGPTIDAITVASVPLPTAAWSGVGLLGVGAVAGLRKRR